MSQGRSASGKIRWRAIVVPVVLTAWLLRAFIPLGFMPAAAEDGWVTLVICTGDGVSSITIDAEGRPVEPAAPAEPVTGKHQEGPCPQSASAKFAAAAVTEGALPSLHLRQIVLASAAEQAFIAHRQPGALGSRAPPFQS